MATAPLEIVDRGPGKVVVRCIKCDCEFEICEKFKPGVYNSGIDIDLVNGVVWPMFIVCQNLDCRWAGNGYLKGI